MENWGKILASIVTLLSMLIGGAKVANDQIKIKRREKEIEDNDKFDEKLDRDIEDGDLDVLNKDLGWEDKVDTPKEIEIKENDSKEDKKTVDNLNDDLGWTEPE